MSRALAWQDLGLCAEIDPELWFPEKGRSNRAAKQVCRACPVKGPCLEYALEDGERAGVYGGMSEYERRRLRRAAAAPAAERLGGE